MEQAERRVDLCPTYEMPLLMGIMAHFPTWIPLVVLEIHLRLRSAHCVLSEAMRCFLVLSLLLKAHSHEISILRQGTRPILEGAGAAREALLPQIGVRRCLLGARKLRKPLILVLAVVSGVTLLTAIGVLIAVTFFKDFIVANSPSIYFALYCTNEGNAHVTFHRLQSEWDNRNDDFIAISDSSNKRVRKLAISCMGFLRGSDIRKSMVDILAVEKDPEIIQEVNQAMREHDGRKTNARAPSVAP